MGRENGLGEPSRPHFWGKGKIRCGIIAGDDLEIKLTFTGWLGSAAAGHAHTRAAGGTNPGIWSHPTCILHREQGACKQLAAGWCHDWLLPTSSHHRFWSRGILGRMEDTGHAPSHGVRVGRRKKPQSIHGNSRVCAHGGGAMLHATSTARRCGVQLQRWLPRCHNHASSLGPGPELWDLSIKVKIIHK